MTIERKLDDPKARARKSVRDAMEKLRELDAYRLRVRELGRKTKARCWSSEPNHAGCKEHHHMTNHTIAENAVTHTPGPWTNRSTCVYGAGSLVAEAPSRETTPGSLVIRERAQANARLIAASPTAFDLIRRALALYSVNASEQTNSKRWLDDARAYVAAVEGR